VNVAAGLARRFDARFWGEELCQEKTMTFEYWLAGIATAFLTVYLFVALIKPERF